MKTTLYFLFALVFLATSCTVDVPDTDRIPPTFSFQISGDGFNHTFTQDDDFTAFRLHLRRGYEYDFVLSGGDSGGLKDLRWLWFNSSIVYIDTNIPSENITEGWNVDPNGYVWFIGDRDDALSGAIITGSFTPGGGYPTGMMDLGLFAQDFGGLSGNTNFIEENLTVVIGNHATAIIPTN